MNRYSLVLLFVLQLFFSCGSKTGTSVEGIKKGIDSYISEVNENTYLKQEDIEGALTDEEGFKDIGNFKYTVFFDAETNQLYKIKNIETTAKTISETYYFRDNALVLIETDSESSPSKIYIYKNKVLAADKTVTPLEKLLLNKGKRFQRAFKEVH